MNHSNFSMMAATITWIYGASVENILEPRHKVRGHNSFALSDLRSMIATGALRHYCPIRGMGEKPSPLGEDFSKLAVSRVIFVSVPPHISVNNLLKSIEGKSSRKLLMEFKTLSRQFWGRHLWARGYFAANSGNVTDEVIMQHIAQEGHEPPDGDFKIDGSDL